MAEKSDLNKLMIRAKQGLLIVDTDMERCYETLWTKSQRVTLWPCVELSPSLYTDEDKAELSARYHLAANLIRW